jgi:histidyl-tRNA synthetase
LRPDSLRLLQQIRQAGCSVDYSFTPAKSDKQFKRAMELKAAWSAKLERDPAGALQVKIKNLKDRTEESLPVEAAVAKLGSRP